jgi:hypothetical protein
VGTCRKNAICCSFEFYVHVVYGADKILPTGMSSKCNMAQLDGLLVQLLDMHKRCPRSESLLALVMEAFRFILHI